MQIADLPEDKKIILFDGVCNLCDETVQKIIKNDKKDLFRFVPLQSELGQEIITYLGVDTNKLDSIILYEPKVAYFYKSEAIMEISKDLGGWLHYIRLFSWLPIGLANPIYDYIAKNRYKWYGKKEQCMIPTPELKQKFL
uniref:thiol-disulfide oxidoreductase DCC family protein n=1 Tax=Flavobacterium sp. TaxID=239 RepID=UPI0040494430